MTVLIIGGASGLGREIGALFREKEASVYVTGRSEKPVPEDFHFLRFDVRDDLAMLTRDVDTLVSVLPPIDTLVYAAGFLERGHITELSDSHLAAMANVGIVAPALIVKRLLQKRALLAGLIVITSTSQWRPREREPMYAATKAGLAMLAESLSLDSRIKKTLVVGPTGMRTPFWAHSDRETHGLLSPHWVAERIMELWDAPYSYRLARILRDPVPEEDRVQVLETINLDQREPAILTNRSTP